MSLPEKRPSPLGDEQALQLGQALLVARQALGISVTAAAEAAHYRGSGRSGRRLERAMGR